MKTKNIHRSQKSPARTEGSVLIIALVFCVIMGISLASYLTLARTQQLSITRSQWWNASMAITEAGVEDGLAHINTPGVSEDLLYASNGYTGSNGTYSVTRYMSNGYYIVTITTPTNSFPLVTSQGYAQLPPYYSANSGPMFAAVGADATPVFETRKVQITTKKDALLTVAMAAKGQIDFKGNNVATDSFDSGDTNYNTGGLYDSTKDKANGDVVTDSNITNSLSVANSNIKGTIRTGPTGSPSIGPNGTVGDLAWVNGGNLGVQPGHYYNDMNVNWPDVTQPDTALWINATASSTNIGGVSYKYYLRSGNYVISDFTQGVYIDGDVNIYVPSTGRVQFSGQDTLYINNAPPRSTSLKLYVGVAAANLGGQGIMNATGNALNFIYLDRKSTRLN